METGRLTTKGEATSKPLSATTVRQHHMVLRQALTQAVKWNLLARNPIEGVTPPKKERQEADFWTHEEAATFLAEAAKVDNYPLYALALGTRS